MDERGEFRKLHSTGTGDQKSSHLFDSAQTAALV